MIDADDDDDDDDINQSRMLTFSFCYFLLRFFFLRRFLHDIYGLLLYWQS